MYVRYKGCTYKINIKDGKFILSQQLWLITRRFLRFFKRIALRSTNTIIVIICAILFAFIIIPIGLFLDEYDNWYDAIWDMRTFLLTSVFVVLISTNINAEKERRRTLNTQFETYTMFVFRTESYIEDLLLLTGSEFAKDIFLTERHFDDFNVDLASLKQKEYLSQTKFEKKEIIELISLHQKYLMSVNNTLDFIYYFDNLELHKDTMRQSIEDGLSTIEKEMLILKHASESYTYGELIEYVTNSLNYQSSIIAELRRPWRWDHNRNMEIRNRLFTKGKPVTDIFDSNEYWL